MEKRSDCYGDSRNTLSLARLEAGAQGWLLETEYAMCSEHTLRQRKERVAKLLWFLREKGFQECGPLELRAFLAYIVSGHQQAEGRWGHGSRPASHQCRKPVKPSTVKSWHADLSTLFRYLIGSRALAVSPLEEIARPKSREDQIRPFSDEQVKALLAAAAQTHDARRDEAILLFMLDTGARAAEVCGVRHGDLDFGGSRVSLLGKGDKVRMVYYGKETRRALWGYLKAQKVILDQNMALALPDEPLFASRRGAAAGEPLTPKGLGKLLTRLGKVAGIRGVRCSPHSMRHTAATNFLLSGGSLFALQTLLGHADIAQTRRYCTLADADLEQQHRTHSPADRLLRKRK